MINILDFDIFKNHQSTLREASKDNHNNEDYFMTESQLCIVNFDAVKEEYIRTLQVSETPKSNDALMQKSDGRLVFIEFKNGKIDSRVSFSLRKKVSDSLLIFTDIIQKGISFTRCNMDYILIYNEIKNPSIAIDNKQTVQISKSRDRIGKEFSKLGGTNLIKYNLEVFKNYCFTNVYTFTEAEFEDYLDGL